MRLIAGPTASGKSAVALELAQRIGGVVINADALQLYADLRILTARPSAEEEALAPHRLYGVADAADGWSVGRWLEAAKAVLAEAKAEGRAAIVVGGTGLYFHALTRGLAEVPPISAAAREEAEARFDREGEAAFRIALAERDPAAVRRIFPGDRQRLVRAYEVLLATGKPLSDWQSDTKPSLAPQDWSAVVLEPARDALYARCDRRLEAMLDQGVLAEVEALMARRLNPALPAMKATGLRELAGCLRGEWSREVALEAAQRETRRYAKRQLTWLRNQAPDWPRLVPA